MDAILKSFPPLFDDLHERSGRPGISPGQPFKARILMVLQTVRSERLFCEQPGDNLLRMWFPDRVFSRGRFNHSIFARSSERLFSAGVARHLLRLARPELACAD